MKNFRALFLAFLLTLATVAAASAEHYGAIRSGLAAGEFSMGIGADVDAAQWDVGSDVESVDQQVATLRLSLGLGGGWEGTVSGGAIKLESDDFAGYSPLVAATIGGPLFSGKTLSIGPFLNVNYLTGFEDGTYELDKLLVANAGLTFQIELEGASLYFGPVATVMDGTQYDGGTEEDISDNKPYSGFAGVRWLLPANWPGEKSRAYLDLEARFKDNFGGGAALNFTF